MKKKVFLLLSALFALAVFFAPKQASAAEVTKNGTAIEVKNPTVQISGDASDLYARWGITFKVDIPDNIDINMNDTMTFKVNSPVKIQSSYSFPIYNKAGETVAYAEVSPENGNVTVTFGPYFKDHKLNKNIELTVDVKWEPDNRLADTTQELDFNGTVVSQKIDPLEGPTPGEMVTKWGLQPTENAEQVHWWARLNQSKKTLKNVEIKDVWDSNQTYVPGSLRVELVDSENPWVSAGFLSESDYEITDTGIKVKIDTTDKIIYVDYIVNLVDPTKNPQNRISITADGLDSEQSTDVTYTLLSGSGTADGEMPETTTTTTTTTTTEATTTTASTTTEATTTTASTTTEATTTTASTTTEATTTTASTTTEATTTTASTTTEATTTTASTTTEGTTTTASTTTEGTTTESTTTTEATTTTASTTTEGTTTEGSTTETPAVPTTEEPKRPELPNTGTAKGFTVIIGGVLVVVAATLLFTRKKENQ